MPFRIPWRNFWRIAAGVLGSLLIVGAWPRAQAQHELDAPLGSFERQRTEIMFSQIRAELKSSYYDPTFHGIDMDARFHIYQERLQKAPTLGEAYRTVAAYLSGLQDSHTYFYPPPRNYRIAYGYRMQMVGDKCLITVVRPETDAADKVHTGDEILKLGTYTVNRDDLDSLEYYLNLLAPQPATDLTLRDPSGNIRKVQILASYREGRKVRLMTDPEIWKSTLRREAELHLLRNRWVEQGDVLIWKLPIFISDEHQVGYMMGGGLDHMVALGRKHKVLILDLRGNPGGELPALQELLGGLFDHDVKIAKAVMRKSEKEQVAKTRGRDAFTGQLIVLVDSRTASAAELLARVVQLEHRGVIVGDRTSGSVMESLYHPLSQGGAVLLLYGVSITMANLVMTDGKSLEKVGVTPDVEVLPTAEDLAAGRDPVLAKAAELAGIKLAPAAAGKMFPFEWAPF